MSEVPKPKRPHYASEVRRDKVRNKTRICIGDAFDRWRRLKAAKNLKTDAEVANFLLDNKGVEYDFPLMMSSPAEARRGTPCSFQASENGEESAQNDAACQTTQSEDSRRRTDQSEYEERDVNEDDEDLMFSLSVGDGRYLVDLGSSSEFIVDEECILQLFKSCRKCNRQCTVRKQVKGLQLVINQKCGFCESRWRWTNLPDEDEVDLEIN